MKLIVFGVLCCICIGLVSPSPIQGSKCHRNLSQNSSMFLDLSVECQLLILENLELKGLIETATAHKFLRTLAVYVFDRKFTDLPILLHRPLYNDASDLSYGSPFSSDKYFTITDPEIMLNLLEHFGHLIRILKIDYQGIGPMLAGRINKLLNTRCSENLIQFEMKDCLGNTLTIFEKPFTSLERVSFNFGSLNETKLSFDELFPKLHRLHFQDVKMKNGSVIDKHLPNLTFLSISLVAYEGSKLNAIEKLVQKNPQIKSLQLYQSDRNTLKFFAENLPQLEELKLLGLQYHRVNNDDVIRFERVKKLTIKSIGMPPSHMEFEHLEELALDPTFQIGIDWINLAVQFRNLSNIEVMATLSNWQLTMLAHNLHNLRKASIKCTPDVKIESIGDFVANNRHLEAFELSENPFTAFLYKTESALRRKFSDLWHIEKLLNGVLFQRK